MRRYREVENGETLGLKCHPITAIDGHFRLPSELSSRMAIALSVHFIHQAPPLVTQSYTIIGGDWLSHVLYHEPSKIHALEWQKGNSMPIKQIGMTISVNVLQFNAVLFPFLLLL